MITVYKYTLLPTCTLELPEGAEILTVGAQGEDICIWVKVDTDKPTVKRSFQTYGTGMEMDSNKNHDFIGTTFLGSLVFHTFEIKE